MSDWNAETAEWYARKYGEYATNRLAVERLDLPADATLVDVGCGTGSALRHAAERVTHGALIGIDPVPRMVEIAREQTASHRAAARISYREGSAEDLPLEDSTADFVLAFDSFDHWTDKPKGLAETGRILRPAGRLIVVKDESVPGGEKARQAFAETLAGAGFLVKAEDKIEETEVSFRMWVCELGT